MSFPTSEYIQFRMPVIKQRDFGTVVPPLGQIPDWMKPSIENYLMQRMEYHLIDCTANGVPSYQIGGGVIVTGYHCMNCKRFFIAADLLDFEHGCTEDDCRP